MSAVDDRLLDRAETLCSKLGEEGRELWADMRSCSNKYAHAPFTAPLTPRPLCDDATFVAMLRIRVGTQPRLARKGHVPLPEGVN
jgi:hypothetical protein